MLLAILFFVFASVFLLYPQIDIYASTLFWDGREFYMNHNLMVKFIYEHVNLLSTLLPIIIILLIIYQFIVKKDFIYASRKNLMYILLVGILGAGILVNNVLKEHWGRARPRNITEFAGDKRFSPPLLISNQCEHNCSFVCGHSSFGYIFLSLWFITRKRWVFWLAFGYGTLIGMTRIMQGGHFLSDVIFSFFAMYASAYILYRILYRQS